MTQDGLDTAVLHTASMLGFVSGRDDDYIGQLRELLAKGRWTLEDLRVYFQLTPSHRETIRKSQI